MSKRYVPTSKTSGSAEEEEEEEHVEILKRRLRMFERAMNRWAASLGFYPWTEIGFLLERFSNEGWIGLDPPEGTRGFPPYPPEFLLKVRIHAMEGQVLPGETAALENLSRTKEFDFTNEQLQHYWNKLIELIEKSMEHEKPSSVTKAQAVVEVAKIMGQQRTRAEISTH